MYMRRTLVALDIDGTLKGYGGSIGKETIDRLLNFAHVGIVSSRGDAHQIARMLGLGFADIGKSSALRKYAETYPNHLGRVYIADTPMDDAEANKAGWNFVDAHHIKLNLGCGNDIRRGYINIDCREIKGIDLCYRIDEHSMPFESGIVEEVLAQDVIEHISWRRVEFVLQECFRVLKRDGKLIIRCPDLEAIAKNAILNPNPINEYLGLRGWKLISFWVYGDQAYGEPSCHRSGFTITTLRHLLEEIGFRVESIVNDGGTNIIAVARKG